MIRSDVLFQAAALPYELLTRNPVWESRCVRMLDELPAGAKRVLDLGCGPGNSTVQVANALGRGVFGLDYARAMLHRARARSGALPLVCGDGTRLPIRSATLDAVTFHSVLYLLPDRRAALAEVARVLRPGGRVALLEPQAGTANTIGGIVRAMGTPRWAVAATLWRGVSGVYGRFTRDELRGLLETSGLAVRKAESTLGGLAVLAVAERPLGA